ASESWVRGNAIYAPVDLIGSGTKAGERLVGVPIPQMPEEVILETIEKYAQAALRVKQAGFGMVLLHGGHGWFINQMMSPVINTRNDKWGGSIENRMRLPIMICDRIKEVCGKDFLIDFRFSAADVMNPGGYGIEDGVEMAKYIDGHVDLIHCSVGNHEVEESFTVVHPSMFLEEGCNLKYAAEVKKHVKTPVVTVGAFSDPAHMESVIAEGKADAIAIARGLLCDPELPNKARQGRDEDIDRCLQCLACFSGLLQTKHFSCALNPVTGRELENKFAACPVKHKKVMVAGGGIAGMKAALTAANLGHKVILCEISDHLGGVLRCEKDVSFKQKLDLYLERQAGRVFAHPNIEVKLNTAATYETAVQIEPDAIIAALGAKAVVPTFIPGWNRDNVFSAEHIYNDLSKSGKNVVILGGGLVGCELAVHLAMNGRSVTVLEMASRPNFEGNLLHGDAVLQKMKELGVKLKTGSKAVEIEQDGVITEDGTKYGADTVIYAVGQQSRRDETDALRFAAPEFYSVGDCNLPATIAKANKEAYYAARDMGRF
ncbi:MAG: FAD-dependent oxidoreductase, partial [Oscillospiraceae bacterium]|nr:FAD-dependent oxidoreductase [Oscillospiraceae bacterium]